jgi:IS605 OrfB family transposase
MVGDLRTISPSFVVSGPSGVVVRTRLRVTEAEERVLGEVGALLGSLASCDLAARCRDGLSHDKDRWAARKREVTAFSSSRWAGSITKASHDQWGLARRGQVAHLKSLDAAIAMVSHRLSVPVGEKGTGRVPGGYRSKQEWHAKSRRLAVLKDRRAKVAADAAAGRVHVVRGGKRLANTRHHLDEANLTVEQWQERWVAARMFLSADGESGKAYGNETIRITPGGVVSVRLPEPLKHLANAPHGRFVLATPVVFKHREDEWADRVVGNRAVAYTITFDPARGRWYVTACWQPAPAPQLSLETALASGCLGVDTNNDHLAAWRLDVHGNPVGAPKRFPYDLSGAATHRDAQIRHALTRLLHWARRCGAVAVVVEDLDFAGDKTRERHGRNKKFRQLISRFPTSRLRARLVSMAAETGIAIVAADPAYTSRWGGLHWQTPTGTTTRKTSRHEAAAIVIGRRGQGFRARRRTSPPPHHQSDGVGHRNAQTRPRHSGREEARPPVNGPRARRAKPPGTRKWATRPPSTVRGGRTEQDTLPLSDQDRLTTLEATWTGDQR